MYETAEYPEVSISAEQISTLARILDSFLIHHFSIRVLSGRLAEHEQMIAVNARIFASGGASNAAEWIIRKDGEVVSRGAAASDPGEWLREGQEAV